MKEAWPKLKPGMRFRATNGEGGEWQPLTVIEKVLGQKNKRKHIIIRDLDGDDWDWGYDPDEQVYFHPKKDSKKELFIVVWDREEADPAETFETLEDAELFITESLHASNDKCPETKDAIFGSIRVYKGRLVGVPTFKIS